MSSYVVLARKWRPGQFSDIVGQQSVVRTLINAIRTQRIHQAYLLTGSRGIGKTTIARIFAKAVRCENPQISENDFKSCDQCVSCKEITAGNGVDVIEIDGASNNGVDAIREIRENAKYLPSTGSRKIYIIDEVHMLTTAAFNALLKTLEEPPAHVIFIFATTEPHKIPATILSRCQRFDLKRVTTAQAQTRLTEVLAAEGIEAEPAALALISRASEGGMRDALSLLDQAIAYSAGKITTATVREFLGMIEGQALAEILRGILDRKPQKSLEMIHRAYQDGHDLKILTRGLVNFLYETILMKAGLEQGGEEDLSSEEREEIRSLVPLRSLEELELIFQALHYSLDQIARSSQPKVILDILVIKCAMAEALVSVDGASAAPSAPAPQPSRPVQMTAAPAPRPVVSQPQPVQSTTPAPTIAKPATPPASAPQGPKSWEGFIRHVKAARPMLATILEHANQSDFSTDVLVLLFNSEDAYFRDQLQAKASSEPLTALAKEYFGTIRRIKVDMNDSKTESVAGRREREQKTREDAARDAVKNSAVIREAQNLFGGDLGPIELSENNPHV